MSEGFALDRQPGSWGQTHKTYIALGGTLLKEAGDRYLLCGILSIRIFFSPQIHSKMDLKKKSDKEKSGTENAP